MTPVIQRELEILQPAVSRIIESLLDSCAASAGDLAVSEEAIASAVSSLRPLLVSSGVGVCVAAANRDYVCPTCQVALTLWGSRQRLIITISGQGHYPSRRYHCRQCKRDYYPWETACGLDAHNQYSLSARALIAQEAAENTYEQAAAHLRRIGIDISPSEVDRSAREVAHWRKQEEQVVREVFCQQSTVLPLPLQDWSLWPAAPAQNDFVVFSVDGAMIRSNEKGPQGLEWFEMRSGLMQLYRNGEPLRKFCIGGVVEPDRLFEMLSVQWRQAPHVWTGPGAHAPLKVFVADGAEWIWDRVRLRFADCIQVLDIYHAAEHVGQAARAAFGLEDPRTKEWINQAVPWLLEAHGLRKIIRVLNKARHSGTAADSADLHVQMRYLCRHRARMRYKSLTDKGLPVGSGTIESTIKQLGTQRLRRAGMKWTRENADLMMHLRAATLSGALMLTVDRQRRITKNRAEAFYTKRPLAIAV